MHNRRELTKKFVSSLLDQTFKDFHLLLVDDGSTDGTDEMVKSLISNVTIFKGKGDWWWAGSIQQAYYWIKKNGKANEVVLIINDDLVFEDDYLEKGSKYIIQNPNSIILSAAYNHKDRSFLEDCGVIYDFKTSEMNTMPIDKLEQLNCASTRGLFLKVNDFILTKGMRPFL